MREIVIFNSVECRADAFTNFEKRREEALGKGWRVVGHSDAFAYLVHEDGRAKILDLDEVDFLWETAEEYAAEMEDVEVSAFQWVLVSSKFQGTLICFGKWKRWNGVFKVARVVPGNVLSRVMEGIDVDDIMAVVDQDSGDFKITAYDHDGYYELTVREVLDNVEFDSRYADPADIYELLTQEGTTKPIGAVVLENWKAESGCEI